MQRVVPGRNTSDHTEWFADNNRITNFFFELVCTQEASGDRKVALGQTNLNHGRHSYGHTNFTSDCFGNFLGASFETSVNLHQVLSTLFAWQRAPAFERGFCSSNCFVNIASCSVGNGGDDFFGRRIGDFENALAF